MPENAPKILTLDIETSPAKAYVWGLFDQNVGISQLISPSAPICVAAKWLHEDDVMFFADWTVGHEQMIASIWQLVYEANAVVGYNSQKFDLPKLQGEFLLQGLPPPPPITSIDLYKTVKQLGFQSGKLAYVGPFLGIGEKVTNEGFGLWSKVMDGDKEAQQRMQGYCEGDVTLTETLYLRLLPYIKNHPNLANQAGGACGACGSTHFQNRGTRRTKYFSIQRRQCQKCGSWCDGARHKI